jgi:hypothetical protein
MTTPNPADVETVARAMYGAWHDAAARPWEDQTDDVRRDYLEAAPAVLAALADRLMPEGTETEQKWRWVSSDGGLIIPMTGAEAEAFRRFGPTGTVETRTVYATPWTPEGTDG